MAGRRRPKAGKGDLSEYGLMSVGGADMAGMAASGEMEVDASDAALEDELAALLAGSSVQSERPNRRARVPMADIDAMAAEGLRDDGDDVEVSDADLNDPDLLAELEEVTEEAAPPPAPARAAPPAPAPAAAPAAPAPAASGGELSAVLLERLEMYRVAEANAKEAGQSSRARRFGRGLRTLEGLLRKARAGRVVSEDDIPPPVYTGAAHKPAAPAAPAAEHAPEPSSAPEPEPAAVSEPEPSAAPEPEPGPSSPAAAGDPRAAEVERRRDLYKHAAVQAKKAGDRQTALHYVRVVKAFEQVLAAMAAGEPVDLSDMPPPPPSAPSSSSSGAPRPPLQRGGSTRGGVPLDTPLEVPPDGIPPSDNTLYGAPPPPQTVLQALQERLQRYKQEEDEAKEAGNGSKARRFGRICKQYTDAIKRHEAGRSVAFDELPTPPGFGPIPTEGAAAPPAAAAETKEESEPEPPAAKPGITRQMSAGQQTRQQKQMALLESRRRMFMQAALQAKKAGDMVAAKEYLRSAKGFEPLLEATQHGLPVNMDSLPVPPQQRSKASTDFEVVSREEAQEAGKDDDLTRLFQTLEADLVRQAKMCQRNQEHFQSLGDVAEANRFDRLAQNSLRDLEALRHAYRRGDFVPKFHYETREFQIVKACVDLNSNELEMTIVRGINYNVPNPRDVDTYVKWEFPWPQEAPPYDKTGKVKNTNDPEYNAKFMIAIDRSSRSMMRVFKRQHIKCEVWERGCGRFSLCCPLCRSHLFGWTDQLIGTAKVELEDLQNKCVVHKAYNVLEGRRTVKGKLEVKLRMRKPTFADQVENIKEKWLVIDRL